MPKKSGVIIINGQQFRETIPSILADEELVKHIDSQSVGGSDIRG